MANHASALKAHRQSVRRKNRNRSNRSTLRTALKIFNEKLNEGRIEDATKALPQIYSEIDHAIRKGVLSSNAAARNKSRLSKHLNAAVASQSPR
jgi:small subunit ribosomal protein S20